tara:strand:- start:1300 stop:1647 length:348 start_codon:yes stop_codon:yes gene_type:complete
MYYNGLGIKKDKEKGLIWFKRAADLGSLNAKLNLADIYLFEKSYKKAFYWFERATKQNSVYAQENLAKMYLAGLGTSKDKSKAIFWYKQARKQGSKEAKNALRAIRVRIKKSQKP